MGKQVGYLTRPAKTIQEIRDEQAAEYTRRKSQRKATVQQRELSVMGFDEFCQRQHERILRTFTQTETDTDLPLEQVEAMWRTARLGGELTTAEKFDIPEHLDVQVRR